MLKEENVPYNLQIQDLNNFLGMFGFWLEQGQSIKRSDVLEIYSYFGKDAQGKAVIMDDTIAFYASTSLGILKGSYSPGTISNSMAMGERYWQGKVNYNLTKNDKESFVGETYLDNSFFNKMPFCLCHHTLDYLVSGAKCMSISFQNHGKLFAYAQKAGEDTETIDIMPYDDLNGYIRHDIRKGPVMDYTHETRHYACVYPSRQDENKFGVYKITIENYEDALEISSEEEKCETSSENIIKMGTLMSVIDPVMFQTIEYLNESLKMGSISLFEELIKTSLVSCSKEEIKALFGIDIEPERNQGSKLTI